MFDLSFLTQSAAMIPALAATLAGYRLAFLLATEERCGGCK